MYGWIYDYAGNDACRVNNELHRIIYREARRMKTAVGDFREDWLWDCAKAAMRKGKKNGMVDMEYVEDSIMSDADEYIGNYRGCQ